MARRAVVALAAVAVLGAGACSDDGPGAGEARLEVDGRAVVERADGEREVVRHGTDIATGDRVELVEGSGTMDLPEGASLELRSGLRGAANSQVLLDGDGPVVEAGDVLVAAPQVLRVSVAGTVLALEDGLAHVSRRLGVRVAAYDGAVHVDSAEQEREVPALRELSIPALGRPAARPRPLDYDAADPWDRRILGEAIDLGDRLESLARGYTRNLSPGEGRTPGFFKLVLPSLDDEEQFGASLLQPPRDPGETLIGAAITDLGRRGQFVERWRSVFGFRDEGARWGLVALDQGVSGTPLLGVIEDAVSSSPLTFVASPPTTTGGGGGPTTTTFPPQQPTTTTTTQPTTTTSPPTTEPPGPTAPLDPALEPIGETLGDVVDGLLGLFSP